MLTDEQQHIVNLLYSRKNVIVNAVAGSGKTSTILSFARQFADTHTLLITYNKSLKDEVRIKAADIPNIIVTNYHSIMARYYHPGAFTDVDMNNVIIHNKPLIKSYDIQTTHIIIDEMQDANETYFLFVYKFLKDTNLLDTTTICCLGDIRQCIYKYKNSDPRFLTLSDKLFCRPFEHAKLTNSFRITPNMCDFLTNHIFNDKIPYIRVPESKRLDNKSTNVKFYSINTFVGFNTDHKYKIDGIMRKLANYLYNTIKNLCTTCKYTSDDFFILSNSTMIPKDSNYKLSVLSHIIKTMSIRDKYIFNPIVVTDDNYETNQHNLSNKIVFTTMHQSKGRERKCVILLSCNERNHTDVKSTTCPNILYVALTRATEHMIVIEDTNPYSFIKKTPAPYIDYCSQFYHKTIKANNSLNTIKINPSIMSKNMTPDFTYKHTPIIMSYFKTICISQLHGSKCMSNIKIHQNTEAVSDIVSLAVNSIFNVYVLGKKLDIYYTDLCKKDEFTNKFIYETPGCTAECIEHMTQLKHKFRSLSKVITIDNIYEIYCTYFEIATIHIAFKQTNNNFRYYQIFGNKILFNVSDYLKINEYSLLHSINLMKLRILDNYFDEIDTSHLAIKIDTNTDHVKLSLEHPCIYTINNNTVITCKFDILDRRNLYDSIWELKHTDTLSFSNYVQIMIYQYIHMKTANKTPNSYLFNTKTGQIDMIIIESKAEFITYVESFIKEYNNPTIQDLTDEQFIDNITSKKICL
jgi:hypothetical protein